MTSMMLLILVAVFFIGIQVFTAVYVYRDAKDKNLMAGAWTAMNVFLPFIGILIYSVLNPKSKYPVQKEPVTLPKPDIQTGIITNNPSNSSTVPHNTALLGAAPDLTVPQGVVGGTIVFDPLKKTAPTVVAELVFLNGPRQSQRRPLKDGENTIGRGSQNTIVIEADDQTVSANQAMIQKWGETSTIINRSQTNKTKVNGQAVVSQELKDNDMIEMGSVKLRFWNRKLTDGNDASAGTPQA